jgi:hypothetical protein
MIYFQQTAYIQYNFVVYGSPEKTQRWGTQNLGYSPNTDFIGALCKYARSWLSVLDDVAVIEQNLCFGLCSRVWQVFLKS